MGEFRADEFEADEFRVLLWRVSGERVVTAVTQNYRDLIAWQKAMAPTYKWAEGRVGKEVLDLLGKELNIKMN